MGNDPTKMSLVDLRARMESNNRIIMQLHHEISDYEFDNETIDAEITVNRRTV